MEKRKCIQCPKVFLAKTSPSRKTRGKFCSRLCKTNWFRGKRLSSKSEFKKGLVPWNKGLKGFGKNNNQVKGKDSGKWKGNSVSYYALHGWVKYWRGRPKKCEHCGKIVTIPNLIHWANKSGEYKRDLNDWLRLCYKCHKKYDKR